MSVDTYYPALETSEDTDFQIHLRRPPSFCFINNYFQLGLKAWYANIDIQHVVSENKTISSLSKTEDSCSDAMKQALR